MECERCNHELSAYVDGKLTTREARQVREHLACCRRCREDVEEIQKVRGLLRGSATPQPSPAFWAETYSKLRDHGAQHRPRRTLGRWASAGWATAAGLALALIVFLTPPQLSPAPVETERTVNPATLVSLHATMRADTPLSDLGKVRYALTEANAIDLSDDARLDSD